MSEAILMLETRIKELEATRDRLQAHNSDLVVRRQAAEQLLVTARKDVRTYLAGRVQQLQLDQETSDRDRGWNAALRQVLGVTGE